MLEKKKITYNVAQRILEELAVNDIDVKRYVEDHNLSALSDSNILEKYCKEAVAENPKAVDDYRSGKEESLNFLLGQVMRKSRGKADPNEVKEMLKDLI